MGSPFPPSQFKFLLVTLRQPASIAALISLGVHAVLFGSAPGFSSLSMASLAGASEALAEQRQVPLVELTPEEQSRLPDFSNSAYSLFPGSGPNSLGLLPVPGSRTPLTTRPSFLPPNTSSGLGAGASSNPFAIGTSPYVPPSIVFPPQRNNFPPVVRPQPGANNSQPPKTTVTPSTSTAAGAAASTPTTQSAPGTPAPSAADLLPQLPPASTAQGGANASGPIASGSARGGDNGASSRSGRESGAASGDRSRLQARLQALAYNPDGTTGEEATAARQTWLTEVKDKTEQPDLQVAEPIEVSIPYRGRVCLSPEPASGLVGAWTTADGSLGEDPVLLRSTGYSLLNQEAKAAIAAAAANFPETDTPAAYEFEIKIDYNAKSCVSRDQLLRSINAG